MISDSTDAHANTLGFWNGSLLYRVSALAEAIKSANVKRHLALDGTNLKVNFMRESLPEMSTEVSAAIPYDSYSPKFRIGMKCIL